MFRVNVKVDNKIESHLFPNVEAAFDYVLTEVATVGDYEYYNDCCGKSLRDVNSPELMAAAALRNCFENVILACED